MVAAKISALLFLPVLALAAGGGAEKGSGGGGFTMDKNGGVLVPKIPAGNKDADCMEAYKVKIECSNVAMMTFDPKDASHLPDEKTLDRLCTDGCRRSLQSWIRGKGACGPTKFLQFLGLSNSTIAAKYSESDIQQFWINQVYWDKCLTERNLKYGENKYCIAATSDGLLGKGGRKVPTTFYTDDPDAFCAVTTCGAQAAYLWAPKNIITKVSPKLKNKKRTPVAGGGEDKKNDPKAGGHAKSAAEPEKGGLISLKEACPHIDTSKFPRREDAGKAPSSGAATKTGSAAAKSTGARAVSGDKAATATGHEATQAGKAATGTAAKATGTAAAQEASKSGAPVVSPNAAQQVSMVERSVAVSALLVAVAFTLW
ncbi:hypothetical protein DRE_00413 [Drechslerella stenobrocha 248]|uniref:Uncharacterized protein n=1 Tax=Drechslerella stenobrocha 248 TaxID=1043628 RepID=W7IEJ6_9PEZI|nr:hypothetical protein DRE_00413 [Drechslerella stenobrocha 248]